MKIHEYLKINGSKAWTQGSMARDRNGRGVQPLLGSAECFCALGLISKTYRVLGMSYVLQSGQAKLLEDVINHRRKNKITISQWNDDPRRTFGQVYKAFKKADI